MPGRTGDCGSGLGAGSLPFARRDWLLVTPDGAPCSVLALELELYRFLNRQASHALPRFGSSVPLPLSRPKNHRPGTRMRAGVADGVNRKLDIITV
jgi:hypothetical protein